jgi:hypothetical protein
MPPRKLKPRIWPSLIVAGMILLTGCEHQAATVTYCPTAIHPDDQTRAWLHTLKPPPPALHYFSQLAYREAFFERQCQ